MKPIYAQLWSVRDYTEKDFLGTLKALKAMGYTGVEFAGYGGYSAEAMKQMLEEVGLEAISAHIGLEPLMTNLEGEIAYLKTLGAKYIVCPGAPIESVASALKYAEIFNQIGEKCQAEGLVFGYHNHAHEFKLDEGQYPLDVLFAHTHPEWVKMQPDLFWVAYAGLDPIAYVVKNKERMPIIHLKQIANLESKENVDAGSGIIDFAQVMALAESATFVYEQEEFVGTSLENMEQSMQYFLNLKA